MRMRCAPRRLRQRAFTLTELLVVIAIIVIMAGLGITAFKGGSASDGTRGASYAAASLFDAARNEAIMRRVPVRVIFDVGTSTSLDTSSRRMTIAYTTNNGTTWIQSGKWIRFPASAYFDYASGGSAWQSRGTTTMSGVSFGSTPASMCVAYEFLPTGQANQTGVTPPLKVVFSPGSVLGGKFAERPDKKSLYGFVVNKLGHTQQFADLQSLLACP